MRFELDFRVWGLRFGVLGLRFGVWGLRSGVWGFGFKVWGLGFISFSFYDRAGGFLQIGSAGDLADV